jgi:nucleoside-diphosphate-sugar epimerase
VSGRLLVTGGTGFIGQAVAVAARRRGWTPVLADRAPLQRSHPDLGHVECRPLDLADPTSVAEVVAAVEPAAIVHLAAYGAGSDGLYAGAARAPERAVEVNVGGFLHLLRAASGRCRRVVWASSTTVLGPVATYPAGEVDEGAPTAPSSVYGVTKLACEELARVLSDDLAIEAVGLRLPLVYGPGRWYGGSQEGLVRFVADLLAGRPARIRAWTEPADWIHVADAADALLAAVDAAEPSRLYHLLGHRGSLVEFADALAAAAHVPAEIEPADSGGPGLPLLDTRRVVAELSLRPRFTTASAGAADYIEQERRWRS